MRLAKLIAHLTLAAVLGACLSSTPAPIASSPAPTEQPTSPPTDAPTAPSVVRDLPSITEEYPCPDSDFTCVVLNVPLDHFDPANPSRLEVVLAMLRATGERKGMFVTATGGPGASGIASADDYTAAFDPGIPEHFDIVFFDQRGMGESGGLQCVEAAAAYYRSDLDATTTEGETAAIGVARTLAEDCVREMRDTALLPYLGTRQAVEDLEAFREVMGDQRLWLYGESYGTQFAQTYAAAHPGRLAGLILDGAVDLTLTGPEFLAQQAQAFNDVLVMTLEDCNTQVDCANDMGGDALAVYDSLAARLAESPLPFTFPLPSGGTDVRFFSLADLETVAATYLYSEDARMLLQRALAAAARDDLTPLARLLYDSLALDPETLAAIPDPTYSDAVYYAVECNDYTYYSGTPDERAQAYIRAGDAVDASVPRLSSIFYGDLPCAFWPGALTDPARPAPLVADGVPTLVLGATADPATPVSNGEHVYRRLADGYLVTTQGGAHVIFGRGNTCPDDLVTAFLLDDELPTQRGTACEGVIADAYAPLAPIAAAEFADPLEALLSADDEIYYLPEYYNWDGETPASAGCPFGGVLAFEASDERDRFTLTGCAFSAGFVMTGTGAYDIDADRMTVDVTVSGLAEGSLAYTRDGDAIRVTGEYAGQAVDLSQ